MEKRTKWTQNGPNNAISTSSHGLKGKMWDDWASCAGLHISVAVCN